MQKSAVSAILLWIILASSQILPASSHTTLGTLDGSLPYLRKNDHELNPENDLGVGHVPGPLAHIWPGSGLNMYTGNVANPPSYQSPFQDYECPLQVAGSKYSPEGAIPASTADRDVIGDIVIGLNFSRPDAFPDTVFSYGSVTIYVPTPLKNKAGLLEQDGFEPVGVNWELGEATNIVTTITDNYGNIYVTKAGPLDPFGPNWWMIRITASRSGIRFVKEHDYWYYVRINQVRAPVVAGRYCFKIFLDDHYPMRSQNDPGSLIDSIMPAENWPVVLVKGDVDPGIIYGTIRYGGTHQALYGAALWLAGRVRVSGLAIDSATGRMLRRAAEARGYFNASSKGHYEVEGIAPGIYDIYASAAGFPEQKVATSVRMEKGQSLALDLHLKPGTQVKGEVFAKSFGSNSGWSGEFPISIIIYDSDDYKESSVIAISPTNLTHAPFTSYVVGNTVFEGNQLKAPNHPKVVAFPWEGPVGYYPYATPRDLHGAFNGVGPAQTWWVSPQVTVDPVSGLGSTGMSFVFQFGAQGFYGVPAKLTGMVPQIFATWVDGLQPQVYFMRAYAHGYVQTTPNGLQFKDCSFKISSAEHDAGVFVPVDVYESGVAEVTVHFHDSPRTSQSSPIGGPDSRRCLVVEAFDHLGQLSAFNFTSVSSSSSYATLSLSGLGMAGVIPPPDPRSGIKYSLLRYRGVRDYGIPPGTHTIRTYLRGYIQASPPGDSLLDLDVAAVSTIGLDSHSKISLHMYRGGGINVTVRSVDWQIPRNQRNWTWNNTEVSTLIYDVASRSFIDVVYFWNSATSSWSLPRTNSQFNMIPWPDWRSKFGAVASYLKTNGSVVLERFGPALPSPVSGTPSQDMATNLFIESVLRVGFLFSFRSYRSADFRSSVALYPGVYSLTAWTYGYVQDGVHVLGDLGKVSVVVPRIGSQADSSIQVMTGTTFDLAIKFRTEGIFRGIPCNSSMRIRIYDDSDRIVAAALTSLDPGVVIADAGFFADQDKIVDAGGLVSIPSGTKIVEYRNLAGLYKYTELLTSAEIVRRALLFTPDCGIWGSTGTRGGYRGNWTVKVDLVNWYSEGQFYPPAPGLLQGESAFLHPYNHLGPYESRTAIAIPNALIGGHASIVVALDLRAYIRGGVYSFNWFDEVRTASWALVEMKRGKATYRSYSLDGFYDAYLPQGSYDVKVTFRTPAEGEFTANRTIFLSDGVSILGENFFLGSKGVVNDLCSEAAGREQNGGKIGCARRLSAYEWLRETVVHVHRDSHLQLARYDWRDLGLKLEDSRLRDVRRSYRD